jgi:hypothetical protein
MAGIFVSTTWELLVLMGEINRRILGDSGRRSGIGLRLASAREPIKDPCADSVTA